MKTSRRVFAYLKRYPALGLGMMSCAIVGTLMLIVFPASARFIINDVIEKHHPEHLLPLLCIAFAAIVLQNGLNSLRLNNLHLQHYDDSSHLVCVSNCRSVPISAGFTKW